MSPLAIIFDLDDTLYPERDYVLSGFAAAGAHALSDFGLPGFAATCRSLFASGVRATIFDRALAHHGMTPSSARVAALVAAYRSHQPSLRLHADAAWLLDRLAGKAPLGLITDGPGSVQRAKIDALRLVQRLDRCICTDELGGRGYWKPHPVAFEQMMRELPAAAYVYIADNPAKDFIAPNALGWTSIQIQRPGTDYVDRPPAVGGSPAMIVRSLAELNDLSPA